MPAGQVSGLVRDDADHLVRGLRIEQRAGVDHHAPAARHEGIELAVLHEHDLGVARADAGGAEDRRGIVAEERFDLGVADDGLVALLRIRGRRRARGWRRGRSESALVRAEAKMLDVTIDIRFAKARMNSARLSLSRLSRPAIPSGCLAKPRDERKASYVDGPAC